MRTVCAAAAALLSVAIAGPAFAAGGQFADQRAPSSERVEIADVDFRDSAQVRAFHERLQQAALFVCGVQNDASGSQRREDRACAEQAVREAVNRLDRPLLTATYQRSGAPMVARGY